VGVVPAPDEPAAPEARRFRPLEMEEVVWQLREAGVKAADEGVTVVPTV
jgi:hypothetical protein